VMAGVVCIM